MEFCKQCRKRNKQLQKEPECETCAGRPPDLNYSNVEFLKTWSLVSNSFFYVTTMESVIPTSLNWTNVESALKLFRIKPTRMLIKRMKVAEHLTIKQANTSK